MDDLTPPRTPSVGDKIVVVLQGHRVVDATITSVRDDRTVTVTYTDKHFQTGEDAPHILRDVQYNKLYPGNWNFWHYHTDEVTK